MNIIVVNAEDPQLGVKERTTITCQDIYRVSALWVTNNNGEILLAQRKLTKKNNPGKWGPAVAGTVEEGETYKQNVIKEAQEEIGLTLTYSALTETSKELVDDGLHRFFCQWFKATLGSGTDLSIQETEVEKIEWFTSEKLHTELKKNPSKFIPSAKSWNNLFLQ